MSGLRKLARYLAVGAVAALAPVAGLLPATTAGAATPSVIISEVAPWASGNAPYAADWWELTNTGSTAVNITGWKIDDNSNSAALAVALTGVTSIAAGQSVVFIEGTAATAAAFTSAWFGASPPSGFTIGSYSGSGVGLGNTGDAVNIYDAANNLVANVTFGASDATSPFQTFDNTAGVNGAISLLSTTGVNGAFVAASDAAEIGSPGTIGASTPVPEAPYLILLPAGGIAASGLFLVVRRRRAAAV